MFLGAVALALGVAALGPSSALAATCVVGPTGTHATIQSAVNDVSCTVINVQPGAYAENVNVHRTVTINGAQAGNAVGTRTFAATGESTVTGEWTIAAPDVVIDGFSLTNPGQPEVITVKTAGSGATIQNNIIDTVGGAGQVQAIYLELGPDNVEILDNRFNNIQSTTSSAKAVLIGDSTSANPSTGIVIDSNVIQNITAARGAYGIQANNGASTAPAATGSTSATISDNTLTNINGAGWAHAIGLEGDTPNTTVTGNTFTGVVDGTPTPVNDAAAVFFEANPSFASVAVNNNNFNVGTQAYGIALHPSLLAVAGSNEVNGTCNWWGASNGPGPVGPGAGAQVTPNVDYSPWLTAPAPSPCAGATATSKDQCKNGGWQTAFRQDGTGFKNQGDCIQYVNTGK